MNKTISLSLAKQISEAAKEKGVVLPGSEKVWCVSERTSSIIDYRFGEKITINELMNSEDYDGVPAYDCAELGEMLPEAPKKDYYLVIGKEKSEFYGYYEGFDSGDLESMCSFQDKSLSETMGKMYLYLIQNGYIK